MHRNTIFEKQSKKIKHRRLDQLWQEQKEAVGLSVGTRGSPIKGTRGCSHAMPGSKPGERLLK